MQDSPHGVSRLGSQAGTQAPDPTPVSAQNREAGPEALSTVSLPNICSSLGRQRWRISSQIILIWRARPLHYGPNIARGIPAFSVRSRAPSATWTILFTICSATQDVPRRTYLLVIDPVIIRFGAPLLTIGLRKFRRRVLPLARMQSPYSVPPRKRDQRP